MSAPSSIVLLSRIAPVSDEEAAQVFGAGGRERLLDAIVSLSTRGRPARRRPRRPLVIALATIAVVGATAATWAYTRAPARETTAVDCLIDGQATVIDATSGDPAADCAVAWQQADGAPAPPLQAYDNGLGGVTVIPRTEKPPAEWTPIASQDVALIELQDSLDDHINGLNSTCFDAASATTFAQQQLDRLGFTGWTIHVRPTSQTGHLCYGGFADPATTTVTLLSMGNQEGSANWPPQQLATSLRALTKRCLSLPTMQSQAEQRATKLGMSQTATGEHNYQLNATQDNTRRCTTLYETVGGTTDLILRGPAN